MAHFLITGASGGLGEALALELGRRGHALGLVARRAERLDEVAAAVRAVGGTVASAAADVTDNDALTAAIRACEADLGPVDTLVANAGGSTPMTAARFDAGRTTDLMRLNYDGVVNAIGAVLPAMLARGSGHLAAVSSVAAWRGLPSSGPYSASKAALTTLLESLAVELRPTGVAVSTIHPGFVSTPFTAKAKHPMPFLITPDAAARIMADGLVARRRNIDFPRRMVWLMSAVRVMPWWLYEPLTSRALPQRDRLPKE